ncbi:OB-fold domain-containing protein [Micromonospora sonneratiae]|jgi:uncharacterized OB-fold protein|uniref:Zn-ribbon domain-containing OB-fold protein n=1 Tax=Micromonospora sonneratiae TaxID=1184706 RepID=A0ABW3Y5K8_9ACTN
MSSGFPLPVPDEVTEPWWAATRERRLLLQTCRRCRSSQHYPRAVCISCGHDDLGWVQSAGAGVVDSFTVVHRAPVSGVTVPYVIARVRLDDGPVLLTRIEGADEAELGCDRPVTLGWSPLPDGHHLPIFHLADAPDPRQEN